MYNKPVTVCISRWEMGKQKHVSLRIEILACQVYIRQIGDKGRAEEDMLIKIDGCSDGEYEGDQYS